MLPQLSAPITVKIRAILSIIIAVNLMNSASGAFLAEKHRSQGDLFARLTGCYYSAALFSFYAKIS